MWHVRKRDKCAGAAEAKSLARVVAAAAATLSNAASVCFRDFVTLACTVKSVQGGGEGSRRVNNGTMVVQLVHGVILNRSAGVVIRLSSV